MKREILDSLLEWKDSPRRKPLILRGARQVGKTYILREFGKSFTSFCEVNFDETPAVAHFFKTGDSPVDIISKLGAFLGKKIVPGETLLFFDEIQSCEEALRSVRYFYEKLPELHLCCAGSLLEFAIEKIPSFGVGRVQSLFMYPLNFREFLTAGNETELLEIINQSSEKCPLPEPLYVKSVELFRIFTLIGGFPEVVAYYIKERDIPGCFEILDELMQSFKDDFSKYRNKISNLRIEEVFFSATNQAGGKFKYSNVSGEMNHQQIKEAVGLLQMSGLLIPVFQSGASSLPLGASVNSKFFKLIPLDTGLYNKISGIKRANLLTMDAKELVNAGALMEIAVGLELLAYSNPKEKASLYYWHREARASNAEVDYVIECDESVIPIEVKSGTKGSMQSMHLFLETKESPYGIRCSLENFGELGKIKIIPTFAVWKFGSF